MLTTKNTNTIPAFYKLQQTTFILMLCCISLQAYSQGGPPMITDDPGTVEKGHLEINTGIASEHTASESVFEFPFIDINCGINSRQHINFEVPLVTRYVKGEGTRTGTGKAGIGTKFRFINQDNLGIDVATHPAFSFALSNKTIENGLVDEGVELFIPVEIQKNFGKNILGTELGRLINSKSPDFWTYGLLYAREMNAKANAAIELNGNSNTHETAIFLNLGGRISIAPGFIILLSAGKSIVMPRHTESIYIGYLALQIAI